MQEEDEEGLGAIGFMFDSMHERFVKDVHISSPEIGKIALSMTLIGEDPGHRQSGHYLWPAAQFLAEYLAQHWEFYYPSLVIELGSGVGLCGILCACLDRNRKRHRVILTDYDPGCLELLKINILNNNCQDNASTQFLQWGTLGVGTEIEQELTSAAGPVLLIGSDLLYCTEVVRPLFQTISEFLKKGQEQESHHIASSSDSLRERGGQFLLASSFDIGEVCVLLPLLSFFFLTIRSLSLSLFPCIGCQQGGVQVVQEARGGSLGALSVTIVRAAVSPSTIHSLLFSGGRKRRRTLITRRQSPCCSYRSFFPSRFLSSPTPLSVSVFNMRSIGSLENQTKRAMSE
jgi:predicted nicotinamide N-methyase